MINRNAEIRKTIDLLEEDMELLGITGVEDKLQDDVAGTIESLRHGDIKVWMLTGDKFETAKCIAISAGFKSNQSELFEIRDGDHLELYDKLVDFSNK